MVNTAFTQSLQLVLGFLVQRKSLTPQEAELLYQILLYSESVRMERDDTLLSIDEAYLADEITYSENYEARLKTGCAEICIHPRGHEKEAQSLLELEVLTEKHDGVAPTEPSNQVPLEILLRRTALEPILKHLPTFTRLVSQLSSWAGIIVPLSSRQKFVNEITYRLPSSASALFSKSPSIFNPLEFETSYSNHTCYFAEVVGNVNRPLFYFWDLNSVSAQIRDHLNEITSDTSELMGKYVRHFGQYAHNKQLTVICSSNSAIQEDWEVIPFVSAEFLAKGEREDGKLVGGAMVNRKRLETILGQVPVIGKWVKPSVETVFEERFERLRRSSIDDPHSIILKSHDEGSISEFVAKLFDVSASRNST